MRVIRSAAELAGGAVLLAVAVLLMAVLIAILPVLLPFVFIQQAIHDRRVRRAAEAFACLRCGAILGTRAVMLADQEFGRRMAQLRRDHPNIKFRMFRTLHALCPVCGQKHCYLEKQRTFILTPDSPADLPEDELGIVDQSGGEPGAEFNSSQ